MQHPHSFRETSVSFRPARLLAFAGELPSETRSTPDAKPESKQPQSSAESDAGQAKRREQRDTRQRRETWERACEQMTDEQLLQTLGELHVKSEDSYQKLNFEMLYAKEPERQQLSRQIEFIEEQLAGARQVWMVRKHAKQPAAEWTKEVTAVAAQLVTARERFKELPTTSPRYAEERLKLASLNEQNFLGWGAERLTKK